jgi:tetratricopeptide (TPR) repeat protein
MLRGVSFSAVLCALTVTSPGTAQSPANAGFYMEAAEAYQEARAAADGAEREAAWRRAAQLYEEALRRDPAADAAPEAAILGADAYKQLGEFDSAISMYELLILEYGSEARLARLANGVPFLGVSPDPRAYAERLRLVGIAFDQLVAARLVLFDHARAARLYDQMAAFTRFSPEVRGDAARNAALLHALIDRVSPVAALATDSEILPPPTP